MSDTFTPEMELRLPHEAMCPRNRSVSDYAKMCNCARGAALAHIAAQAKRIEELEQTGQCDRDALGAAYTELEAERDALRAENARLTAELREVRERFTQELSAQKMPSQRSE